MPRIWFSGPRLFGGLIRPGISFDLGGGLGHRRQREPQSFDERPIGGYVYVIRSESGHVKLGSSVQPIRRLAQLQTGSPHLLELIETISVTTDPYEIEREAHALLDRYRVNGEWFATSPELAMAAIYAAADKLGCSLTDEAEEEPLWWQSLFSYVKSVGIGRLIFIGIVLYVTIYIMISPSHSQVIEDRLKPITAATRIFQYENGIYGGIGIVDRTEAHLADKYEINPLSRCSFSMRHRDGPIVETIDFAKLSREYHVSPAGFGGHVNVDVKGAGDAVCHTGRRCYSDLTFSILDVDLELAMRSLNYLSGIGCLRAELPL